jgi:hypothetical protein
MKLNSTAKVAACLAALFLFGGVCGFAMSGRIAARWGARVSNDWVERWRERRVAADFAVLQPDAAQAEKLRPLYDKLVADFLAIQADSAQRVNDAFRRLNRDVREHLTPEQRQRQRELIRQRRLRGEPNRSE